MMIRVKKAFKLPGFNNIAHNTIVIELGQESLAMVEVANRNNGAELVRFAVRSFPVEGLNATWLKAIWHQEHFSQRRVVYCLPAGLVEYKSLVMPLLPFAQLEAAVKIEINSGNSNGGHLTKLVKIIDWQNQGQMLLVNVALIDQSLLNKDLQLLKEAGLEVAWSGLRYQGLRNFINFNSGFFEESSEGTIYLDFGDVKTEVGIIQNETLVYRRELALGSVDLCNEQDPDGVSDFLDELRLTFAAYQADTKHQAPLKLVAFGTTETIATVSLSLTQDMGLSWYTPEKTKLTGVITHKYTPRIAPLIGLALDDAGILRPEVVRIYTLEQDRAGVNREKFRIAIGMGIIVVFLFSGITLSLQASSIRDQQTSKWLSHNIALLTKLRQSERQTIRDDNQMKQLNKWLAGQNQELEFILLLKENLPDGTQITDLTIENGIVKDLSGVTPSASSLLNKLKAVPGLQNLKLKGTISASLAGEIFQLEGAIYDKEPSK
jgi:hypothetical protein